MGSNLNWPSSRLDSRNGVSFVWFGIGEFAVLDDSVGSGLAAWGAVSLIADWGVMNSRRAWDPFCMGIWGVGLGSTGVAWDQQI